MSSRKRVFTLILIMALSSLTVAGITIFSLYQTAIGEQRERLVETSKSQARLIEAVARFDAASGKFDGQENAKIATLSQIIEAHKNYEQSGRTMEFTLGERRGDSIIFLLRHRHGDLKQPKPFDFYSKLAEPMRRALSGRSGTLIGVDYRGELVLAAHEPVSVLNLGIVAKIDLSEIRRPFLKAAAIAGFFSVIVVLSGAAIFLRISNPIMKILENHNIELAEANNRLKQEIVERTRAEEKIARLQKMEALGLLAGGVAHDLNNVLSGLVGYPDLLLMELPEESPLRQPIINIQKSGQKAADIVQDLLALARRGVITSDVLNLNDIVMDYLASPEHERLKVYHANVHIETNLDSELLNIKGSPVHLRKTVMNLVSNAAEAQAEGGKITISTRNQYVDRPLKGYDNIKEGDYVVLKVSDNGIGMSAEELNRIFEPFYTKKVMGRSGTGLGMAVVWGTVQDHRGYIDIESKQGEGTSFDLYFSITRDSIVEKKSVVPIETYMGTGQKILIVDDVREQRELASSMLTNLGYCVKTLSSGEKAIEYLKENSAALVILDMIMDPGIDGLKTYRQILKIHPKQKAIIASGFTETKRAKETQKIGAGQYIKKPYTLEKIGMAVKVELEK